MTIAPLVQPAPSAISRTVGRLDAWLDTMRGSGGYGGPVCHWWQQCFTYTGAALDWRYEGIIAGYLALWERCGEERWLAKALRAGDDLLAGQSADGHYTASAFELNPATAGTPHEASCDAALLLLADALRRNGRTQWVQYARAAEHNLRQCYIDQLWSDDLGAIRDGRDGNLFVPNKASAASEALFLLAEFHGDDRVVARYALPTLERVLEHQVRGGPYDGAIAQNSLGARRVEKYFPIYIARCVPALLRAYRWTGVERYADAALRAVRFIARQVGATGRLPTVVYPVGRTNVWPAWIAPLGDVLRAVELVRPLGLADSFSEVERRLLGGQDASGGIQTAFGFAAQAGGRQPDLPDVRDVLHVAGWCDKAFRYLAERSATDVPSAAPGAFETECVFRGRRMRYRETEDVIEVTRDREVRYRWHKGTARPEVCAEEFWLR